MCTKDISLKAACADTFYYPQDWDPSKGSLDSFQRKRGFEHHFGKQRTKNLHKGVLQIRFEMPFKVQCLRCQSFIGQGSRYDADKKKVGMYFSSPLYEFMMHCRVVTGHEHSADGRIFCNQTFIIRTDPKNDDYELAEGLRRKVETWDAKDSETIELVDPETRRKMNNDPMFRVEQTVRNVKKEKSDKERLRELEDLQFEREDTYILNSMLRRSSRAKRKEIEAEEEAARLLGPANFCIPLAPASEEDMRAARAIRFRTDHDKVEVSARRAALAAAPLFPGSGSGSRATASRATAPAAAAAARVQELVAKRRRLAQHALMARASG